MRLVRLVRAKPGLSRLDLAAAAGLPRATVQLLVGELLREGWLGERPTAARGRAGRRPVPLELDRSRLCLLGAEVGVDTVEVVACDLAGGLLLAEAEPLRRGRAEGAVAQTCALVAAAAARLRRQRRRPLGLGVGVQGMMDARQEVLRFAPNLGWHDVPVARLLREGLARAGWPGLPALVLNVCGAAALSECAFGPAQPEGPLVYLELGVGLGAGIVLGGRLLLGHGGMAGEVGHTILVPGGPACTCGRRGCAEALISLRAVSRAATGRGRPVLAVEELAERLRHGDRRALAAAAGAGAHLGLLLQHLVGTLDPEAVVLGGRLCALGDPFLQSALRTLRESGGRHDHRRVTVRLGRFGQDAAAVGAAGAVLLSRLAAADALPPA